MENLRKILLLVVALVSGVGICNSQQVYEFTATDSQSLNAALNPLLVSGGKPYNSNDQLIIHLLPNTKYVLSFRTSADNETLKPIALSCNVSILGPEGYAEDSLPLLYVDTLLPDWNDDPLFDFGNGNQKFRSNSVILRNFRMEVDSTLTTAKPRYMLKFNQRQSCDVCNVHTRHSTEYVTNMDLRNCHNVEISNCSFYTANGNRTIPGTAEASATKSLTEGGCLWLRGDLENINIHDNVFKKHGNDEAIGIFSSTALYEENNIRNVYVRNNQVIYGQLLPESYSNQVLLSFNTSRVSDSAVKGVYNNWENIDVSNNTIIIKDYCARVFSFGFSKYDNYSGISACNNTIVHDYTAVSDSQNFVLDYWLRNHSLTKPRTPEIQEPILIANNNIYMREKIYFNGNVHTVMSVEGRKVNFINNLVDGTDFEVFNPQSDVYKRWNLCLISGDDVDCNITNNRLLNPGCMTRIWSGGDPSNNLKIRVSDNYFNGSVQNYWGALNDVNYQFVNNVCENTDKVLMFNRFAAKKSNVLVNGNTFYNAPGNTAAFSSFDNISDKGHDMLWYIVTNNVFVNYSPDAIHTNWISNPQSVVLDNNKFVY